MLRFWILQKLINPSAVHRMHAFVRFEKLQDEVYFAKVEPDFNVLPLIVTHFKNRYRDQKWMIYDLKRHYGIFYDLEEIQFFEPTLEQTQQLKKQKTFFTKKKFSIKNFGNGISLKRIFRRERI